MRVLVLGGDGMLGHELAGTLAAQHHVAVTVHGPAMTAQPHDVSDTPADIVRGRATAATFQTGVGARAVADTPGDRAGGVRAAAGGWLAAGAGPPPERVFGGIDARCHDDVAALLERFRPDAVVNAIGLVQQRPEGQLALPAVEVNTVFPHRLARLCRVAAVRLVHISTACVFSGRRGRYTEDDQPDPVDVHGMSKLLGEVREAPAVTLRTSIIGLEPAGRSNGLVEWFLSQRGRVPGNRRATCTGLTTVELSRLVDRVLVKHEDLAGLWHVATSEAITEYDLLVRLADRLRRAGRAVAEVVAVDGPARDHGLVADRFADATGYTAPGWDAMLDELVEQIMARNDADRDD
ncbi:MULTISPECIES: sugar nucleotide-binding protein [unclassified Pseudofrankia]|uniref:sugar nucleotide-binding protein n=1 Tax=unclassified Pseudofrankia TaxID=2994372 RepID=UPI0009F6F3F2|nr:MULTISPECIES: sugar nucleotide-binding protein [unclassified Pseudofrankia]MDT3443964.1 sugar nucleotide-binding protein [Pseudofrankia sp. BMG5.37]